MLGIATIRAANLVKIMAENVIIDSGANVETTADGSLIDIDAAINLDVGGMVEAMGFLSLADLDAGNTVTLLPLGVVAAKDEEGKVEITGTDQVILRASSAVLAGADFDNSSGTPVAFQTAPGADAELTAGNELIIIGTVTTSDEMKLDAGAPAADVSSYFGDVDSEHYLFGTDRFSIYLHGTLTTLAAQSTLELAAAGPVIMRGNIDVVGSLSDLLIRSEEFVYIESELTVKDQIEIYGGYDSALISTGGADANGSSAYIDTVSILNTTDAASGISILGAADVDIFGSVLAGATLIPDVETTYADDATIDVAAGEQVYLQGGLQSSKGVMVTGGTPGLDDGSVAVLVDTAGGIFTSGETSDDTGGHVEIQSTDNIEIMGYLVSGGEVDLMFDESNNFTGRTFSWSSEASDVFINTSGRAYIGGTTTTTSGEAFETGGFVYANDRIQIDGGMHNSGAGVLVHASSEIVTTHADGTIEINSPQDADIQGTLLAGGAILEVFDASGELQGRRFTNAGGNSTVTVNADDQIVVGTEVRAGAAIHLNGGADPVEIGEEHSGKGLVVFGSANVETWADGSVINLNAPGRVDILAAQYQQQIAADGWAPNALGTLEGQDVTLKMQINRVEAVIEATIDLEADDTTGFMGIDELRDYIETQLLAADWNVISNNGEPGVPGVGTLFDVSSDPLIGGLQTVDMSLLDGRLVFGSAFDFSILTLGSSDVETLGLTQISNGDIDSGFTYTLQARGAGSTINIGASAGPNEKLYIAGKVLADSAINLYSGTSSDGIDVDLRATGRLETEAGSIAFNVGEFGDVQGEVMAGGTDSDVILTAGNALVIRGDIQADRHIELSTTGGLVHTDFATRMQQNDGTIDINPFETNNLVDGKMDTGDLLSVFVDNSANLKVNGTDATARHIHITGNDNVIVNGTVGPDSGLLDEIKAQAVVGDLYIPMLSGRLESDTHVVLMGDVVDVAGVVESTAATAAANDWEIDIAATDTVTISGDVRGVGSIRIAADKHIEVKDTDIEVTGAGETLELDSEGTITLGGVGLVDSVLTNLGGVLSAPRQVVIDSVGLTDVKPAIAIATAEDDSLLRIDAGELQLVGSLLGGGTSDSTTVTWAGKSADVQLNVAGPLTLSGSGFDDLGNPVERAGSIQATGNVQITTTGPSGDVTTSGTTDALSLIRTDATGGGALTGTGLGTSSITMNASGDVELFGVVLAEDVGTTISLTSAGLMTLDGIVSADATVTLTGGEDSTGVGLIITELIAEKDAYDNVVALVNSEFRAIDDDGFLIDPLDPTQFVNLDGDQVADPVYGGVPIRISGGAIETGDDGTINLHAAGDIQVVGQVGDLQVVNNAPATDVSAVNITSTSGDVLIHDLVNSRDTIDIRADNIRVIGEALVKTRHSASEIYFQADSEIEVEQSTSTIGRAKVDAASVVHFYGNVLQIDGVLVTQDVGGLILLNACQDVNITGQVTSTGDIEINAGVPETLTKAESRAGGFLVSELSGGSIEISGEAVLDADDEATLRAADDVLLQAEAVIGPDRALPNPQIVQTPGTVRQIVGSHLEEDGFITVTETVYEETTVQELIGYEEVVVGARWYTMDLTFTQDGFWNGSQKREYFIEGVDYTNQSVFGSSTMDDEFHELSTAQRDQVLAHMGSFRELYDVSIANPVEWVRINGETEALVWSEAQNWNTASTTIIDIDVTGLEDYYLRVPSAGAATIEDTILKVVSQGSPVQIANENVGTHWDTAEVAYTQDRSDYGRTLTSRTVNDTYLGSVSTGNYYTVDNDGTTNERWDVDYVGGTGERNYSLTDGKTGKHDEDPTWSGSTQTETGNDVGDNFNSVRNVYAPNGYRSSTSDIDRTSRSTRTEVVGSDPRGGYTNTDYDYVSGSFRWWEAVEDAETHSSWPGSVHIATPQSSSQNRGAWWPIPYDDTAWLGGFRDATRGWVWVRNISNVVLNGSNLSSFSSSNFSNFGSYQNWNNGEPNNSGGDENFVEMYGDSRGDGDNGTWNDDDNERMGYVQQKNGYFTSTNISETMEDFEMDWTSVSSTISDKRFQFGFQWISEATDETALRANYREKTIQVPKTIEKQITTWKRVYDYADVPIVTTERVYEDEGNLTSFEAGTFDADSIVAVNGITIETGARRFTRREDQCFDG